MTQASFEFTMYSRLAWSFWSSSFSLQVARMTSCVAKPHFWKKLDSWPLCFHERIGLGCHGALASSGAPWYPRFFTSGCMDSWAVSQYIFPFHIHCESIFSSQSHPAPQIAALRLTYIYKRLGQYRQAYSLTNIPFILF